MRVFDWFFIFSAISIIGAGVVLFRRLSCRNKDKKYVISTSVLCGVLVVISSICWFFPAYISECTEFNSILSVIIGIIIAVLRSLQHTMRLFSGDDNYENIMQMLTNATQAGEGFGIEQFEWCYEFIGDILFLVAPLFTFLFILSFFKNLVHYLNYKRCFWREAHIFSELNERSLALAKSIKEQNKKKVSIVFADIIDKNEEAHLDLVEGAKKIGAILFRKDMESINFNNWPIFKFKKRSLKFYLISDDENEKIRHAESIIENYKYVSKSELYFISNNLESIVFLNSFEEDKKNWKLNVIRVNDIRSLVYQNLETHGIELFENANLLDDGTREISAAVVGLGQYGMEMIKALLWYCQLPGYRVKITAFDEQKDAADRFKASCPEIKVNTGNSDEFGDMRYTLEIKKASFGTESFYNELEKIKDVTYLFVCLGTDRQNITAATGIRDRLIKNGVLPKIETVVYDSALKNSISDDLNAYIRIIGDLDSFYSVGTVINSKLIGSGLDVHNRWWNGDKQGVDYEANVRKYYMNDYNFYSSIAGALHRKLRKNIIKYNKPDAVSVFPFYYSDKLEAKQLRFDGDIGLLRELLPRVNDNDSIEKLSEEIKSVSDLLYIKLAYLKYQELSVSERKAVIEKIDVTMTKDTENYLAGYEKLVQDFGSDKDTDKALKKIFDSIIEVKTKGMGKEEKLQYVHSLEYGKLSSTEKSEVLKYIKQKRKISDDESFDLQTYFAKAKCFAFIEHIRWNAYMRTEGFSFHVNTDKPYKLHFNIVPLNDLSFADQVKDI